MSRQNLDRRQFLKVSGAAAGILAVGQAPAFAQGAKLHIVRWVDFIPEADVELKTRQMPEASKALGAEIQLETINANDVQPRITAAVQSQSGADIFHLFYNWPQLYQSALVDVSDLAEKVAKEQGGFYGVFTPSFRVGGRWLGMPHSIVGNAIAYRRSWFREIGLEQFPKTWDELRKATATLKKKGKPYGQTLGHTFGDAPTWSYPLLWSFGGAETDQSGKKVAINSKGAVESVKYMQALWKEGCDEGGLAWDDTNNNRAFHAGDICATLNGASIYIVAKRQKDKIKDEKGEPMFQDIDHAIYPLAGGVGQYPLYFSNGHGIMKYSKNQKLAKDFLAWLHKKENFEKWFQVCEGYSVAATTTWEKHPMWEKIDKPLQLFRTAARNTRIFGHSGPSTGKATEAFSKYIIVDMFAKAVQGLKAEDAVKWAEGELKKIYEG
ncbi:MAG: sugar ABC transporter substrate-binding protein [Candidatus Rokubacteria bacterium 13_1_40CM_69_27]|nr:MAG: sugar ABC transporter substrate-binding protein [Candidatus Rokubacteria bacterium 13_1_40CM_69_27]